MSASPTEKKREGPLGLAENLTSTLEQEREALARLAGLFERHRKALQDRRQDLLDAATDETNGATVDLAKIRQTRERQLRLLGRILRLEGDDVTVQNAAGRLRKYENGDDTAEQLLTLRDAVRGEAARAKQECGELEFALQYALDLGRDLLQAVQGLDAPAASSRYYTQRGGTAQGHSSRSYLNKLG